MVAGLEMIGLGVLIPIAYAVIGVMPYDGIRAPTMWLLASAGMVCVAIGIWGISGGQR